MPLQALDISASFRLWFGIGEHSPKQRFTVIGDLVTGIMVPYIVVGDDGRLSWIIDAFTTSDSYPYSVHYTIGNNLINYMPTV